MSGNDTTSWDNDSSGNRGLQDTTPDLTGGRRKPPSPEDTIQDPHAPPHRPVPSHEVVTEHDMGARQLADTTPDEHPKQWADPLAVGDTAQDLLGMGATDSDQDRTAQDAAGASRQGNTDWEPVDRMKSSPPSKGSVKPSSSTPPPSPYAVNKRFNVGDLFASKYEITGHIGQGGMGVVYRAVDLVLGRPVAIKFLKAKGGISPHEMSRFQQEAKAIAALNHENIIRVHDMSVTADGDPYFVLEFVEGDSLSAELRREKVFPLDRAINVVIQVCEALEHAHEHGIVHRDLKPSNLMVVKDKSGESHVKLLDFGIAKRTAIDEQTLLNLTKTGEMFGSPHYMSPEQCSGRSVAHTSDIYSLGCVLYEMLCGKPPFSGENAMLTLEMHRSAQLPSIAEQRDDIPLSDQVDEVLAHMMAKVPTERYQSARDVKAALVEIARRLNPSQSSLKAIASQTVSNSFSIATSQKSKLFPNGLSDSTGRKNAVLIAMSVAAAGMLVAFVGAKSNWFGLAAPPAVSVVVDKTPWSTYDYKAQKLFDMGSYEKSRSLFEKALAKARTESGAKKALHMNTTLRELRMVSFATKDKVAVEQLNEELLDVSLPVTETPKTSWKLVKRTIEDGTIGDSVEATKVLGEFARFARTAYGGEVDGRHLLNEYKRRVAKIPNSQRLIAQADMLDAVLCRMQGLPITNAQRQVVKTLLYANPSDFAPNVLEQLIFISLSANFAEDLPAIERMCAFSLEQDANKSRTVRIVQAKVNWLQSRKALAIARLQEIIDEIEGEAPRDYSSLLDVLSTRGSWFVQEGDPIKAIPLLLRADAVCEVELRDSIYGLDARDVVLSILASAYGSTDKVSEAEQILTTLSNSALERYGDESSEYAFRLSQLGTLYYRCERLEESKKCLQRSLSIFRLSGKQMYSYVQAQKNVEATLELIAARESGR